MASINTAMNTVADGDFMMTAGLLTVGLVGSSQVGPWIRDNVYDLGVMGDDILYGAVGATATLAFLPRSYARPLALGMVAGGVASTAEEANIASVGL